MKLGEIDKIRNRRNDDKQVGHAKECIKIGDLYMQNGRVKDALEQFKQALKMSKDHISEIEAISHFKIARTLLHLLNQKLQGGSTVDNQLKQKYFLAKNHLIDFQI
jgi:tetratricopeptide (TPR) repeat protein